MLFWTTKYQAYFTISQGRRAFLQYSTHQSSYEIKKMGKKYRNLLLKKQQRFSMTNSRKR